MVLEVSEEKIFNYWYLKFQRRRHSILGLVVSDEKIFIFQLLGLLGSEEKIFNCWDL